MSTAAPDVETPRRRWRAPQLPAGLPWPTLAALALIVAVGLLAGPLTHLVGVPGPAVHDSSAVDIFGNPVGPRSGHPLGVDSEGRDVLARLLYASRSLILLTLAGAALGVLVASAAAALARTHRVAQVLWRAVRAAVWLFPAVLVGLALSGRISPGIWRVLIPLALSSLIGAPSLSRLPGAWATALPRAALTDVALTFLGVGPGGSGPQIGAMIANAGTGIVAGVPAWWDLVFPGAAALIIVLVLRRLAAWGGTVMASGPRWRLSRGVPWFLALGLTAAGAALFAWLVLPDLGGHDPGGASGLTSVGASLAASASLLGGGVVVWALITVIQVRWLTRAAGAAARAGSGIEPATDGGSGAVAGVGPRSTLAAIVALPSALVAAAPVGWLAFLALYVFSESVGKLPLLPGAGAYRGLTADAGGWAQELIIPWLLLGSSVAAARTAGLRREARLITRSGQQRVARGAGVPESRLSRQRRRALTAPLLLASARAIPGLLTRALVIEVAFQLPGAGALAQRGAAQGDLASVSDVTALAALAGLAAGVVLIAGAGRIDPRGVRG